jgi:hypothetical protein
MQAVRWTIAILGTQELRRIMESASSVLSTKMLHWRIGSSQA